MTRSTMVNALIGAAVSIVLSFVPFSPVIGGAVAGYLEGADGTRVGAYAGFLAAVPFAVIVFLGLTLFMFGGEGVWILVGLSVLVIVAYSVVLSTLGGYLGEYIAGRQREKREETVVEGTV